MHEKKRKEKQEEPIAGSRTVIKGNVIPLRSSNICPAGTRGPRIKNTVTDPVNYSNGPGQTLMCATVNEAIITT